SSKVIRCNMILYRAVVHRGRRDEPIGGYRLVWWAARDGRSERRGRYQADPSRTSPRRTDRADQRPGWVDETPGRFSDRVGITVHTGATWTVPSPGSRHALARRPWAPGW